MRDLRLRILLPVFGVLVMGLFSILSGTASLDATQSQTDIWQTIEGEFREECQAESFLRKVLDKSSATALSVAVVQGSDVVFQKSMGIVDNITNRRVDEQTVFRTASLSKPVFAYLVMKLVDEGLLDVDKPLYQYLKHPLHEYPEYAELKDDESYKLLTIRIVLSHQSGFPNWRAMNPNGRLNFKFTPGKMFKYSGEGYRLLQYVLEEMTGKTSIALPEKKPSSPWE